MRPRIAIPEPTSEKAEYNARALPQYVRAVELAGGDAVVVRLPRSNPELAKLAASCDAMLLPGSPADVDPQKYGALREPHTAPADPKRDNADELLLQDAYNMRKPILGICYGAQSLNVWRTGTLVQHVENHSQGKEVLRAHRVRVEPVSLLGSIVGDLWCADSDQVASSGVEGWVNSSHHQAVQNPGDGLRVVARAPDGTIEAVEGTSPDHFVLGVQWHPERTYDQEESSRAIFASFIAAALRRHRELAETPDFETLPR